jgi:small subunit ribosomal protein S6
MPLYESTFIARQDISTQDVEKLTETFSQIVTDNGGKVVKSEYWGLRSLAYLVKKNRKGHYTMLCIDSPYAAVKEMERRMKLNEDVLRNLTIKVTAIGEEASPMMNRSSQDDNDRDLPNFNRPANDAGFEATNTSSVAATEGEE